MRETCWRCYRPIKLCLCERVHSFETNTRFVILMHPMEAKKMRIATGRLSHLSLKNSEIIVGINFDESDRVKELINSNENECYILYPGDEMLFSKDLKQNGKKKIIFVIDGTWPCAKKMMKLSTCLHSLPRISFNFNGTSRFAVKAQPGEYCLSTLESLVALISEMESAEIEGKHTLEGIQKMTELLDHLVEVQIAFASDESVPGYRKKAYKKAQDKQAFKKWQERSLFFKG
jgi:DTW domain-containing protein YfiP